MTVAAFDPLAPWQAARGAVIASVTGADWLALGLVWATVVAAALVTYVQSRPASASLRDLWRHVLPAGTLSHPSARADFLFWLSRKITMPLMVAPLALSTVAAGSVAYSLLAMAFGPAGQVGPAGTAMLCAFTLSMMVAYDLSYYIYHYLCHHVPVLWELHKVHHSAQVMVGVTKDRVHPIDEVLNRCWNGLIPGFTYGVWLFFALDPVEVTLFGLNAYFIRGLLMMDVVRHTHMTLSYGRWLNNIFLCPYYHQLHHSIDPAHYNRNFGLLFSFWDRVFGTLEIPAPGQSFTFGLANQEHDEYQSVVRLHVVPVRKIVALGWDWLQARPRTPTKAPHFSHPATPRLPR